MIRPPSLVEELAKRWMGISFLAVARTHGDIAKSVVGAATGPESGFLGCESER